MRIKQPDNSKGKNLCQGGEEGEGGRQSASLPARHQTMLPEDQTE
jgi:hypothetical protein